MKLTDFYILSLLLLLLSSCTNEHLQEARTTVAEADSLMVVARAEGWYSTASGDSTCILGDSLRLAEAFCTLSKPSWRPVFYSKDYAHASYHYARLLREHGDYPAAMQAFIHIIHSPTSDHIIKGRAYTNIAELCHLAHDFDLSASIFEKSATSFLKAGDSIAYAFALNSKAFELAEKGCFDETRKLLSGLDSLQFSSVIYYKTAETRAKMYRDEQIFDSAIFYAQQSYEHGNRDVFPIHIIAQCYSLMGQADSALYYAKWVTRLPQSLNTRHNTLYILAHDNKSLTADEVLNLTSKRTDIQRLIISQQEKIVLSVQLFRDSKEQYGRFLFIGQIVLVFLFLAAMLITITIHILKRRHILNLCHQLCYAKDIEQILSWDNYNDMCIKVDKQFNGLVHRLIRMSLTEKEIRLCVLVLLDIPYKKMADLLAYSETGISKFKYSTAIKLGTTTKEMHNYLVRLALGKGIKR